MSKTYTTKTASLKATIADVRKLNINGLPFSKVVTDHVPETPTANDIWKYAVTTDDNGVVTVTDNVAVNYSEITTAQTEITQTATKVIDNEVLDANGAVLMNWDTKNFTNSEGNDMFSIFNSSSGHITEWDSDLSSLTNGSCMFSHCTTIESFNGDLSNLTDGYNMFAYSSSLASFSGDLSSLENGTHMFQYTALESFNGDLSSLINGYQMFYQSALASFNGDLSNLISGYYMFSCNPLQSFNGDLSSLINGSNMFYQSALESFDGDLSSLINGASMFYKSALTSFNGDLSNLISGYCMFYNTALTSFNGDLSNLINGYQMFCYTALESFNGDLSSLINGGFMFQNTHARTYNIPHYKMVNGVKTYVTTEVKATGLKSFISNLSSLKSGYYMFGHSASTCSPLDEESIMLIADTINDISSLNKSVESNWTYTYHDGTAVVKSSIYSNYRGKLHLGYDSSITDTTNIFKYCDEIVAKGWTVYLNGSSTPYTPSNPAALIDGESTSTPIPHYYKPVQVTDEEIAEYVDANNNYYIIVGAQHVFGDDISTYGMFTSHEHAVSEITSALGLTPYVKPTEETEQES